MANPTEVRFHLFGNVRAFRGGKEVSLPQGMAGTYLRLLLLSGQPFLDNGTGRRLGTSESIRTIVDKANRPGGIGNLGGHDFKGETGLEMRFREGCGICIEGDRWTSDVQDFEAIWKRHAVASQADLQRALDMFESGAHLNAWDKTKALRGCWDWASERVAQLEQHRSEIHEELVKRRAEESDSQSGAGTERTTDVGAEQLKHETESRNETSGPCEEAGDLERAGLHGAALCGEMCDPLSEEQGGTALPDEGPQVEAIHTDDESAPLHGGPKPENEASALDSSENQQEKSATEQNTTDSPREPQPVSSPRTFDDRSLGNPPRRTVTALGVVIVLAVIVLLFIAGYVAAKAFSSGDGLAERASDRGKSSSGSTKKQDALDDPEYRARAVPDHEPLGTRYLQSTSLHEASVSAENVVIAGQIFTGYIGVNGSMADPTVAVFSLNRQFKTLKCLVGVPDEKKGDFTWVQPQSVVVIEGDGQVLKKVHIRPGVVVPVNQSVQNVKALVISFSHPVVIVQGSVWR